MRAEEVANLLKAAGLSPGRVVPAYNPYVDGPYEHWVLRNAVVVTCRNGVVWQGDLDLDREAYLLRSVARDLEQDLYVVDHKGAEGLPRRGPSNALMREAVWWSGIHGYDKDDFGAIGLYDAWHPRQRRTRKPSPPPGRNWKSELQIVEAHATPASGRPSSRSRGRTIKPVMMHRTALYELVWFDSGHAILQEDFDRIRTTFGEVSYTLVPESGIRVCRGGKLVAVVRPSPVPNRETFAAAVHELSLRKLPRSQQSLIALIKRHLEPVYSLGPEELWHRVCRLLDAFDQRDCSHTWTTQGVTEWRQCNQIRLIDVTRVFRGTEVPVTDLFNAFLRGKNLRDFLEEQPTVSQKQIECVLEHTIQTIDG